MSLYKGSDVEVTDIPACDQYSQQGTAFANAVLNDTDVPTPLQDAIDNMRVIEAAVRSHEQGAWVTLQPS
jgi:predicted dehydrogenase